MFQRAVWRKALALAALHPQAAGRAFQHVGQAADDLLAHLLRRALRRQRLREAQPFLAVVVAVAEEVLAQEDAQPGAHAARQRQDRQHHQGHEHQAQLQRPAPVAAEEAHVVADGGDEQQVGAGQQQRRRMEGRLARQAQRGDPVLAPRGGQQQQRHHQRMHRAADAGGVGIEAVEQHRMREQVQVEQEDAAPAPGTAAWRSRANPPAGCGTAAPPAPAPAPAAPSSRAAHCASPRRGRRSATPRSNCCNRPASTVAAATHFKPAVPAGGLWPDGRPQQQQEEGQPAGIGQQIGQRAQADEQHRRRELVRQAEPAPQRRRGDGGQQQSGRMLAALAPGAQAKQVQREGRVGGAGQAVAPGGQGEVAAIHGGGRASLGWPAGS